MDTMIMAVRVALLILVTGTFTALWSGDHPNRIAAVDRASKVLIGSRTSNGAQRKPVVVRSSGRTAMQLRSESSTANEMLAAPVPEGICAGTYLIVDQFGRTETRTILEQEASPGTTTVGKMVSNHYSVVVGNTRWHFIRIDQVSSDKLAVSPEATTSVH